jgi:two-component system chemotaxis sensor kinase CheA
MEQALLNLDVGNADSESINLIFRGAHSIKGASATFGMSSVAGFTHVMETLLDEMRSGRRSITPDDVSLLLGSIDELRDMLSAIKINGPLDTARIAARQRRLEAALTLDGKAAADRASGHEIATRREIELQSETPVAEGEQVWRIFFKPHAHMLRNGNDALRIFNELAALGDLTVVSDSSELPKLAELDAESSYLSWSLELHTRAPRQVIEDVFSWVEGECDLTIEPVSMPDAGQKVGGGDSGDQAGGVERTNEVIAKKTKKSNGAGENDEAESGAAVKTFGGVETASVRVAIEKIDSLMDIVGELVITQSMLTQTGKLEADHGNSQFGEGLAQLERNTRALQEAVMRIRMLPISFVFNRFPRLVRDLSRQLGKKAELKMTGEQTELDKTIMEKIGDPMVHLVRNALDHGIEDPGARRAAGKPETGHIHLNAYHRSGNIIIEISDDGAGVNRGKIHAKAIRMGLMKEGDELTDEMLNDLIFQPGFSTAESITDVSGRGVGMDVVSRNIKSLGGSVEVTSRENLGSTIRVRLPLTLAIIDGQSIRVGADTFIIPLVSIIESVQAKPGMVNELAGQGEILQWRDGYLPILRLYQTFGIAAQTPDLCTGILMVVEGDGKRAALYVDELLAQQQVVVKTMESNIGKVRGVSGATILGDGTVALILDVPGIINLGRKFGGNSRTASAAGNAAVTA